MAKSILKTNGVSIDSPLRPFFYSYYMSHFKNKVLTKPKIYVWYVNDISNLFSSKKEKSY